MRDELASQAVAPITSGQVIGLGTGRAASRAIRALAARAGAEGLRVRCVATSEASASLARSLGLPVDDFSRVARVDYLFDGADEVDPAMRMLKGRGGAMTRERIVAHAASRRVYLIDESKLTQRLGERCPLPIEVLPFALSSVTRAVEGLGLSAQRRMASPTQEYATDSANAVLDATIPAGADVAGLAAALDSMPGVVDHGLFLTEADEIIVESDSGAVRRLTRER